ncbi:MAG: biotin--[acetyl-CoA-carboxylase] ligase [Tannerellaceae bacterium]|jgi:BirA family biotin operon repressor/biotin-[acetyl-CoA-carboxylase] ligase|nr:biotin--[acetyl-CoA-carboxylase] ligase [Tannerellaceae bacterium]
MKSYPVIRLDETTSTNAYLREHIREHDLPEGAVVMARKQTAGRGQRGAVWESAQGENLTFSLFLRPDSLPANLQFGLLQTVSLAVKKTLDDFTDDISIKWPNDIYHRDGKICGILIENNISGDCLQSSIVGIGMNLNQVVFTGDAPNPVSLRQITGLRYEPEDMLDNFMRAFFPLYLMLLEERTDGINRAYKSALYRGMDEFHAYRDAGGFFQARISDIEPAGHLCLQLLDGQIRRYAFKEVIYVAET